MFNSQFNEGSSTTIVLEWYLLVSTHGKDRNSIAGHKIPRNKKIVLSQKNGLESSYFSFVLGLGDPKKDFMSACMHVCLYVGQTSLNFFTFHNKTV